MTRDTARASDEPAYRLIVARAAARYRALGRSAYYFSRGKLTGDPVFAALLRDGRIESRARIVDLGCGLGLLAALLAAAEELHQEPWPQHWAPAAIEWTLHGFDLRRSVIATARGALSDLGHRVHLEACDVRSRSLPGCDKVVILDVLHYIDTAAQQDLLTRVHAALSDGGSLLLRVADATSSWRFRFTLAVDWCVSVARGAPHRFWCRPLAEWIALLQAIGFKVSAEPMSDGTLFANVLLIARKQ